MEKNTEKTFSLDVLARDVAFEICLGGDRFGPDDLALMLEGITITDLETFRKRVVYHAGDFGYGVPFGEARDQQLRIFVEKESISWCSYVKTAESLGFDTTSRKSWFEGLTLNEDRGKYFLFTGGYVRRCEKATREVAWGEAATGSSLVMELPKEKVPKAICSLILCNYGKNTMSGRECTCVGYMNIPEGRVNKIVEQGEGNLTFVLETGETMDVRKVFERHPDATISALMDELDEQACYAFNLRREASNKKEELRNKANILINRFGGRVKVDFLYDEVMLHPLQRNNGEQMYLRRQVNDLAPAGSLGLFLYRKTASGGAVMTNLDRLDSKEVLSLISVLDCEMAIRQDVDDVRYGIDFENGPKVFVPMEGAKSATFIVDSVFLTPGGEIALSVRQDGIENAPQRNVPFVYLTDRGVEAVCKATEEVMRRNMNLDKVQKEEKTEKKPKKVSSGKKID